MRIGKKGTEVRKPMVMGILNVTPDSFSDGGKYLSGNALEHALEMIDQGADIIDIGGESTRPGSDPVSSEIEIERIVPVIRELSSVSDIPISVDTMKPDVAYAALDAGADIINDVNGLRTKGMADVVSSAGVPVIIMHMKGTPKTMQLEPMKDPVIPVIAEFLKERYEYALDHGIRDVMLDPGIGFGKTARQNMEILNNASTFSFGCPVVIGLSRKMFLSELFPLRDRDDVTAELSRRALDEGADIVRVHDVRKTVKQLALDPDYHTYYQDYDK